MDYLLGRYQQTRQKIKEITCTVSYADNFPPVSHFISGNLSDRRGNYG
ncbi:hypothetical protein [Pantoea sp. GbtcB22]|jgi:hypothetical protein|nr:hypothetical protein [Pantoea sp. GbtcB22]